MTKDTYADLGWTKHFAAQADAEQTNPLRITKVHRNAVTAFDLNGPKRLTVPDDQPPLTVGDWVTAEGDTVTKLFDRETSLSRRAPGEDARTQLIAANVTTLGIVSSCNADFNERRLERYLILATDAGALAVIILTKADQTDEAETFIQKAQALSPLITVLAIDAKDPLEIKRLHPWCRTGDTLALVGSSGVGKTTIRNALTGEVAETQAIREDDARGRHTTTSRALVRTTAGGWLIDTPGMRALRLFDVTDGIEAVFADIEELTTDCRFNDCAHESEPGCAVQEALQDGTIDADRFARWRKLKAEDQRNTETIVQSRSREKSFQKRVNAAMRKKQRNRD